MEPSFGIPGKKNRSGWNKDDEAEAEPRRRSGLLLVQLELRNPDQRQEQNQIREPSEDYRVQLAATRGETALLQ